ncbi:MAG TPA: hypothetical protein VGM05_03075 [Planctomycetaceae bacterium]|jgi:hypothetical protein
MEVARCSGKPQQRRPIRRSRKPSDGPDELDVESVKLTVIHEMDQPDSKFIKAVSNGWPHILASLKSLLETGESLVETRDWPKGK